MRRIDVATAVASPPSVPAPGTAGYFTNGDPGGGIPATQVPDWFLNMVQGELEAPVIAAGLTPSKSNWGQLLAAMNLLYGGGGSVGAGGWQKLPGGLIVQWGNYSGTTGSLISGVAESAGISVTFPTTFPNACFGVLATALDVSDAALQEHAWIAGTTASGMTAGLSCRQAATSMSAFYIALGN